jgi:hypothetical protein
MLQDVATTSYDVIPGWCASTIPQMRNCASGNLEIPGSMLEPVIGPRMARTRWHRPGMTSQLNGCRLQAARNLKGEIGEPANLK